MQKLERLSAIVDDEIEATDQHVLTEIAADTVLKAAWGRYHLMGAVVRDELSTAAQFDLASRIHQQLAAEPTILAPRNRRREFRRPLAGLAIAASVATVAVLGFKPGSSQETAGVMAARDPMSLQSQSINTTFATGNGNGFQPVAAAVPTESSEQFHRKLNSYLVNFNEQRSNLGVPGVHPYVRVVGFENAPAR